MRNLKISLHIVLLVSIILTIILLETVWFDLVHFKTSCHLNKDTLLSEVQTTVSPVPPENILFLKTHKCGSSTIQNILLRYGLSENLTFALPAEANYFGHPKLFNPAMITDELKTNDLKYNIFTHHARYSRLEMRAVMKPYTKFVTILRDPATLFESIFSFYHFDRRFNLTFEQLMTDPEENVVKLESTRVLRFGTNQMCFDLGFEKREIFDRAEAEGFIQSIDHDFDLVMISEYMEVSLVLLADLMQWPLIRVRFLSNNVRPAKLKQTLTEERRTVSRNLNQADVLLYDYFLSKFKQKIKEFGKNRMKEKVEELLNLNTRFYNTCVEKSSNNGYAKTVSYKVRVGAEAECYNAAMPELPFTKILRNQQIEKLRKIKQIDDLVS